MISNAPWALSPTHRRCSVRRHSPVRGFHRATFTAQSAPTLLLFLACAGAAWACSSAVVSGSATADGRPLLWKHRDTKDLENDLRYFRGSKHDFIGLVDTKDTSGTQVWMGSNSAGFSILNTNAYNLPKGDYQGKMDLDGVLMKEALGRCATAGEFEVYLAETVGQRGVLANFGVIDAYGAAAYYEVTPFLFEKYDATDPKVAPEGYLLRTNFGYSGKAGEGSGQVRYQTLQSLFFYERQNGPIDVAFLLFDATRCLRNSLLNTDLRDPARSGRICESRYIPFIDYVVRYSSVSSMIVEGVRPGDDPRLTTLWVLPAFQLTSVAAPVWVAAGEPLPAVAVSKGGEPCYIAQKALALKARLFPFPGRDGGNYLDPSALFDGRGGGLLGKLQRHDEATLARVGELLSRWRDKGFDRDAARQIYNWIDEETRSFYEDRIAPAEPLLEF